MKHLREVSDLFRLLKMFHLLVENVSFIVFDLSTSQTGPSNKPNKSGVMSHHVVRSPY